VTAYAVSILVMSELKCHLARTQARRRTLHQLRLRYQLHSVEGRAKCPTVSQRRELVTGTHAAGQGSKKARKVICLCVSRI